MILTDDRTELDNALADVTKIVMLLSGGSDLAKAVHDAAEKATEAWCRTFLVTNVNILKEEEKAAWSLQNPDRFVVVRSDTKELRKSGFVSEFLTTSGKPSKTKIQEAF